MELNNKFSDIIYSVKDKKPLIHHITNYVTVNDCANVVLALGGRPVMADSPLEVEEFTSMASALVINTGTLNKEKLESFLLAGKRANELGIPVVLDPVGVGASNFRNNAVNNILKEVKLSVLRGNMSEIKNIYGIKTITRGVDSLEGSVEEGQVIAKELAKRLKTTVAISGRIDIISNGNKTYTLHNGCENLSNLTGTGCMASSLIASCCGVEGESIYGAVAGFSIMSISGEKARNLLKPGQGLGSFKVYLMDSISNFTIEDFNKRSKINEI